MLSIAGCAWFPNVKSFSLETIKARLKLLPTLEFYTYLTWNEMNTAHPLVSSMFSMRPKTGPLWYFVLR